MQTRSTIRAASLQSFRRASRVAAGLLALALVAAPASPAQAGGKSVAVGAALVPSAEAPVLAGGEIAILASKTRIELLVQAEGLSPGAYALLVDGVERGVLTLDAPAAGASDPFETVGEVRFSTKPARGSRAQPLQFDPAGRVFELAQGGVSLLTGVAPEIDLFDVGALIAADALPKQKIKVDLAGPTGAQGALKLKSNKKGADLIINAKGLSTGEHRLLIDGQDAGGFLSDGKKTKIRFSTRDKGDRLPLDFDPTNSAIEIQRNGATVLQGALGGEDLPGLDPIGERRSSLFGTAVAPAATGEIALLTRDRAMRVALMFEDAPLGVYELRIDGVTVGRIISSNGEGALMLTRDAAEAMETDASLIDFDPRGRVVQLLLEGRVALGGEVAGVRIGAIAPPSIAPPPDDPGPSTPTPPNVTNITNVDNSMTVIDNSVSVQNTIDVDIEQKGGGKGGNNVDVDVNLDASVEASTGSGDADSDDGFAVDIDIENDVDVDARGKSRRHGKDRLKDWIHKWLKKWKRDRDDDRDDHKMDADRDHDRHDDEDDDDGD